jgi:hypothetical protein
MRGLSFRPGKSWPRNPVPPDPEIVRDRTRATGAPIPYQRMGL